jgi:hypothetical protein
MKRVTVPGAVYGDCSQDAWVCSLVGRPVVLTSWQGEIAAPAEMLSNRLHGRMIAAKTQSPGNVAVFDGQWIDMNIDSPGVQGHAWDDAGNLAILQAGADQESMGLQFYDPSITSPHASLDRFRTTPGFVTGSAAYSPSSPLSRELGIDRLFLWTKRGEIAVGQGDSGGTAIQYQGVHYLLEPGDSRFVQFHRDGDQLAIAITRFDQGDVVFHWLTVADIPRLARYGAPQPDPEPEPTPDPEPEPMPDILRDRTELVKRLRREITGKADHEPLHDAHKAFQVTMAVAWELRAEGWGLVKAKAGSANNVNGFTSDVIAQRDGEHVDVIGSSEEEGTATWLPVRYKDGFQPSWNAAIAERWMPPVQPDGVVTPPEEPTEPEEPEEPTQPGGVTNAQLMAAILKLSKHLGVK